MFIYSKAQFLLKENLKQAKDFLKKNDINYENEKSLDHRVFNHIVRKLEKLPNLIYTFTRMIFHQDPTSESPFITREDMDEFDRIVDWILNNKNVLNRLPKQIPQYKRTEELADDIEKLDFRLKGEKFYKSLYKSMRDRITESDEETQEKFYQLANMFMNLDIEKRKQFTPLKYFEKNKISLDEFIESLENFVNNQSVNDEQKRVLEYLEGNKDKLNVIYNENNVIAIQSNDGKTVCDLGSQRWCIVYSPDSYQKGYFGEGSYGTQYIIYNFNLPSSNPNSMFGVTINPNGKVRSRWIFTK